MSNLEEDRRLMRRWLMLKTIDAKRDWLDFRCNAYFFNTPSGNLEVQVRDMDRASQWKPWLEVRENEWWVTNCNNMSIPHVNLLLDIDPNPDEKADAFGERIEQTKREVLRDGGELISDCVTGSRGRHLEFFVREWASLPRETVRELKLLLLENYGADRAKATPRGMILIPGMPNPKTGRRKEEVSK